MKRALLIVCLTLAGAALAAGVALAGCPTHYSASSVYHYPTTVSYPTYHHQVQYQPLVVLQPLYTVSYLPQPAEPAAVTASAQTAKLIQQLRDELKALKAAPVTAPPGTDVPLPGPRWEGDKGVPVLPPAGALPSKAPPPAGGLDVSKLLVGQKCVRCHGPGSKNGDLTSGDPELLLRGVGEVIAGNMPPAKAKPEEKLADADVGRVTMELTKLARPK
jgi:hypothetical protein